MDLEINGEQVGYTLENEKTLGDVLPSVFAFLQKNGFWAFSAEADGASLNLQEEGWQTKEIKNVKLLQVAGQMVLEIEEVADKLRTARKALEEQGLDALEKETLQMALLAASLRFWLGDFTLEAGFFSTIENLPALAAEPGAEVGQAMRLLEIALQHLDEKDAELAAPQAEGKKAAEMLLAHKEPLTQLPALFQAGKDAEALKVIAALSEPFQKMARCVSFLSEKVTIQTLAPVTDFLRRTTEKIDEFMKAYEAKDYVLAGDIAEYEIADSLDGLASFKALFDKS